jgi:enamine deaminase RidA (YjgF/YER057c/UK114 family)
MASAFNPDKVWQPFGAFSTGIAQGEGQILHLKGQVPLDRDGEVVGAGDMAAQVQKTLENIEAVLAHVGARMGDVISTTHCITDIDAFMAAADIRAEFFAAPYPVTTTAEVPRDRYRAPHRA